MLLSIMHVGNSAQLTTRYKPHLPPYYCGRMRYANTLIMAEFFKKRGWGMRAVDQKLDYHLEWPYIRAWQFCQLPWHKAFQVEPSEVCERFRRNNEYWCNVETLEGAESVLESPK